MASARRNENITVLLAGKLRRKIAWHRSTTLLHWAREPGRDAAGDKACGVQRPTVWYAFPLSGDGGRKPVSVASCNAIGVPVREFKRDSERDWIDRDSPMPAWSGRRPDHEALRGSSCPRFFRVGVPGPQRFPPLLMGRGDSSSTSKKPKACHCEPQDQCGSGCWAPCLSSEGWGYGGAPRQ